MTLAQLGLDDWLADRARELCAPGSTVARVTAVDRDRYLVRDGIGEVPAELAGRYRRDVAGSPGMPCVGDWVCLRLLDARSHAIIDRVLPRRTFLRRKLAGRDVGFQLIAANVDVALVVQACHFDFNVRRLERYLVMVREGHVRPVVLLTKTDLVGRDVLDGMAEELRRAGLDVPVIAVSSLTGEGLDEVRQLVPPGTTCCLLGSSGVGKSTLINRLAGDSSVRTREVSGTGEGRHTTTRRQLFVLEGGRLLVDTPGMRELGMLGVDSGLAETFADIGALAATCRFADCGHTSEPGCAVQRAIARGELTDAHLQNYLKLGRESARHDMSHADRRRKDREFGRLVRSAIKRKGRRDLE